MYIRFSTAYRKIDQEKRIRIDDICEYYPNDINTNGGEEYFDGELSKANDGIIYEIVIKTKRDYRIYNIAFYNKDQRNKIIRWFDNLIGLETNLRLTGKSPENRE